MVAKDSIKANDIIKKYNDAYKTAPEIVKKYFSENIDVIFSCFTEQDYNLYQKELNMKD